MAWTNIFDLGDWDVYVRYAGVSSPEPDSATHWVLAADLDPTVGTVTVVDGVITLELEDGSGGGGIQPGVAVFPSGTAPDSAVARVSVTNEGFPDIATPQGTTFSQVDGVTSAGTDIYSVDESPVVDITSGEQVTDIESPGDIESGKGLAYITVRGGA